VGGSFFIATVTGLLAALGFQKKLALKNDLRHKIGMGLLVGCLCLILLLMVGGLIYMGNSLTIPDAGKLGRTQLNRVVISPIIAVVVLIVAAMLLYLFR